MADQKLTELTDAGTAGAGDTGDIFYIVTADKSGNNSRQVKLGSLRTLAAGDTGRILPDQDVSTDSNPQFATVELGAAADTTLTRVSAGVAAVEGNNIVLDGTAAAVVSGTDVLLGGQTIFPMWREHNLAVNSHFQVSQENGDAAGTTSGYYPADQWLTSFSSTNSATFSVARTTAPGFTTFTNVERSIKFTNTGTAAQSSGDWLVLHQDIEGLRVKGLLNWGAAGGKDLLIGFPIRTSYSGNISVAVRNSGNTRSYATNVAVTANTDTWVSVTIPNDTSGAWLETNGIGVTVFVTLAAGSTRQGTNETWTAGNIAGTSATTDFLNTSSATAEIGPVLVFPEGITMPTDATELHLYQRPYDRDLADCQRYYYKVDENDHTGSVVIGAGNMSATTTAKVMWNFPVPMRDEPTISAAGVTSGWGISSATDHADYEFSTSAWVGTLGTQIVINGGTAKTDGDGCLVYLVNTNNEWIEADARL